MAKPINQKKITLASELLAEQWPITRVQTELKNIFGSGMSNSKLAQIKRQKSPAQFELQETYQNMGENLFRQNLQRMDLIHSKIESILTKMHQTQTEQLQQSDYLDYFDREKARVSSFLMERSADTNTISGELGVDTRLLRWILNELQYMNLLNVEVIERRTGVLKKIKVTEYRMKI